MDYCTIESSRQQSVSTLFIWLFMSFMSTYYSVLGRIMLFCLTSGLFLQSTGANTKLVPCTQQPNYTNTATIMLATDRDKIESEVKPEQQTLFCQQWDLQQLLHIS